MHDLTAHVNLGSCGCGCGCGWGGRIGITNLVVGHNALTIKIFLREFVNKQKLYTTTKILLHRRAQATKRATNISPVLCKIFPFV